MKSFRIGSVAGIQVRLHATFPFFVLALGLLQAVDSGWRGGLLTVFLLICLFIFVLLHELGHCLVAARHGVKIHSINLLPIGGVARTGSMPRSARAEILIALAGPAVNLILALLIMGTMRLLGLPFSAGGDDVPFFLSYLLFANVMLLAFNLLPGFPLDGGRVLRGLLTLRLSYVRATRVAVRVGAVFAGIFLLLVLIKPQLFMLSVISLFIFFAGRRELRNVELDDLLRYRSVGEHLRLAPWYLAGRGDSIGELCAVFSREPEIEYCVVDLEGFNYGLLDRREILSACLALPHHLHLHRIVDGYCRALPAAMPLGQALARLRATPQGVLPVHADLGGQGHVGDGLVLGLVAREDLEALLPPAPRGWRRFF